MIMWFYAFLSIFLVSLVSLVGVFTLGFKVTRLKQVLIYAISFSAGSMLGGAFLHLLPEVVELERGFTPIVSFSVIGGILLSFFLEKVIHWRHCHMPVTHEHVHHVGIMSLVGDSVHNFIDGVIIGISFMISVPAGVATTIAVIFHEIPQEIADFGVLLHSGFTKKKALMMNFLISLFAFLGLGLSFLIGFKAQNLMVFIIPFAVGNFIYISSADLIPELHKETQISKSMFQILFFMLGVLVMFLLTFLEL